MSSHLSQTEADALERWIAQAFAQIAEPRERDIPAEDAILFDQANEVAEPSADADLAALGSDAALGDVDRFLDRTEAWLHGRRDALDLLERLRDRLAPGDSALGEDEPTPHGADDTDPADGVEASAPPPVPEDNAADGSTPSAAEDPM